MIRILFVIFILFLFGCKKTQVLLPGAANVDTNNSSNGGGGGGGGGAGAGGGGIVAGAGILKVNTGDDHSCALTVDHRLFCAGDNGDNQVAAGILDNYNDGIIPVELTSLFPGKTITDVSIAYDSTCAVFSDGTAKCWGENYDGSLGLGHPNNAIAPESIQWFDGSSAEKKIKELKVGEDMGCALSEANSLYCWGNNWNFALDAQTDPQDPTQPLVREFDTPIPISYYDGSTAAKSVSKFYIGYGVACFLSEANDFKCIGRLKDQTNGDTLTTIPLVRFGMDGSAASKRVTNFSLGWGHGCYIDGDGFAYCFGNNSSGKLGCGFDDGVANYSDVPCAVLNEDGSPLQALSISAGDYQTCAITLDHKVKCWGSGSDGAIGNGNFLSKDKATTVLKADGNPLSDIVFLNSGVEAGHVCAIDSNAVLYCWGHNGDGQTFNRSGNSMPTPTLMPETQLSSLAIGNNDSGQSCYIKKNGAVECADFNNYTFSPLLDAPIDGFAGNTASSINTWFNGGCALMTDGGLKCWTFDLHASSVAYFDHSTPDHTATKVARYGDVPCVLANNNVRCSSDYTVPVLNNIIDFAGNNDYFCTVDTSNAVKCYQNGNWAVPISITNLDGSAEKAVEISVSNDFGCVKTQSNKAACWAFNDWGNAYGQLGNGAASNPATHFEAGLVSGLDGVTLAVSKVQVGQSQVCAQMSNRDIYCWGDNGNYAVTDPINHPIGYDVSTPIKMSHLPTGENFNINMFSGASCVIGETSGDTYCWGYIRSVGLTEDKNNVSKATAVSL